MNDLLTPTQQLEELSPYVQVGDNFASVQQRICPRPESQLKIARRTEWALGLRDVNLVLAIESNGSVIAIGRDPHGQNDGTQWLTPPPWKSQTNEM